MKDREFESLRGVPTPQPAAVSGQAHQPSAVPSASRLWKKGDVAKFFGVSERTVQDMREAGRLPDPIVIGPRAMRWIPDECIEAARKMARARMQEVPPNFRRTATGKPSGATAALA